MATIEFNVLMFGLTSSAYEAIATTRELANAEKIDFPLAAEITKRDSYVDDVVSGKDTVKEAVASNLRKWTSNSE